MGTGDRFLLFITAVLLIVLAIGTVIMAINPGPAMSLGEQLVSEFINGRWEAALAGVVILLVGLRLAYVSLSGRKRQGALVTRSELGEVSITVPAVENMVQRTALQVDGIREVRPSVTSRLEGVSVRIKAWVEKDANVPDLSAELQEIVKSHLKEVAGLTVASINVEVQGVGSEPTFKVRSAR